MKYETVNKIHTSIAPNTKIMKEPNNIHYKWKRIFAAKRYHTKDGIIKLNAFEQQELLDEIKTLK